MSAPANAKVTEIDALLAPISQERPSGESLQYSDVYDRIRDARREEEDLEQGEWKRELKSADWPLVVTLASEALATKTKDLQLAAWLAEALVRVDGFDGALAGLRLARGLVEEFWDTVHPEIDEDGDLEARENAIALLERSYSDLLRRVPMTSGATGEPLAYFQFDDSRHFMIPDSTDGLDSDELRRVSELRERAEDEGKVTSDVWRAEVARTSRDVFEAHDAALAACWDEFMALDRAVDERFGKQAPSLAGLRDTLDDIRRLVTAVAREKRAAEPRPGDAVEDELSGAAAAEAAPAGAATGPLLMPASSGAIASRDDALRRLAEVAEYFRRAEPHSPVAFLVSRAIRWGRMPLDAWLADVIKNDGVLDDLRETLGITSNPDGDSSPG